MNRIDNSPSTTSSARLSDDRRELPDELPLRPLTHYPAERLRWHCHE
jgi:hypothetical protein